MDGTFKPAPPLFSQIYVILAEMYGGVLPAVYALLPNKRKATYCKLIEMLRQLQQDLAPQNIISDFETAAFTAFQEAFPDARIHGCFFHLSQNFHRHLGQLGLRQQYINDPNFALNAKMILSLAFVPINSLDAAIDQLRDNIPDELQTALDYFEDNYIGRPNRRGGNRRRPLFPVEMWNVHTRTLEGFPRTNNHAEAANRRLQAEIQLDHPTIWRLIDSLKLVQRGRDLFQQQLIAGNLPPKKLRKYIQADERILRIVRDFANRNILDYLRGISHNFEMQHN